MRSAAILLSIFLGGAAAYASDPIPLWPGTAPGEKGNLPPECDTTKPTDDLVGGRRVTRLSNVSVPTITVFRPSRKHECSTAVVVCPGGGYRILSIDMEGTEVCQWLNSAGVTAVLLKYRVPSREAQEPYAAALQDAQRALSLVRYHAAAWQVATNRIGILGFSAGGHLSAAASTRYGQRSYEAVDAADQISCRPDFAMLIYAGRLVRKDSTDLSPELTITSNTPPTLIIGTADDPVVKVENSLFYYLGLKRAGVPAEMHLYATGGHGYGLRSDKAVRAWPQRAEDWMRGLSLLERDATRGRRAGAATPPPPGSP
jgi:acetyl esterase/lipase